MESVSSAILIFHVQEKFLSRESWLSANLQTNPFSDTAGNLCQSTVLVVFYLADSSTQERKADIVDKNCVPMDW